MNCEKQNEGDSMTKKTAVMTIWQTGDEALSSILGGIKEVSQENGPAFIYQVSDPDTDYYGAVIANRSLTKKEITKYMKIV